VRDSQFAYRDYAIGNRRMRKPRRFRKTISSRTRWRRGCASAQRRSSIRWRTPSVTRRGPRV
jgi:hypothetical protein